MFIYSFCQGIKQVIHPVTDGQKNQQKWLTQKDRLSAKLRLEPGSLKHKNFIVLQTHPKQFII